MQRVYRSDLRRRCCGSNRMPEAGLSGGRQTYRCGKGQRRQSRRATATAVSPGEKPGLGNDGAGMGIAANSRVLELSEIAAAHTWIKIRQFGAELERMRRGGRLSQYFGNSPGFWLNLQLRWDLYHAQRSEAADLEQIQPLVREDIPSREEFYAELAAAEAEVRAEAAAD